MKKIIIFGAGRYGKRIIESIKQYNEISIIGVADNGKTFLDDEIYGCPLIDINQEEYTKYDVIIAIAKVHSAVAVYEQLRARGYKNIYWYNIAGETLKEYGNIPLIKCANWGDCVLPYVEMHIMDNCNLNCRGCTHFSPLFSSQIPDFENKMKDVSKLKGLFSHIAAFHILGGEPLLNPQLKEYVIALRDMLPETKIAIVTNGILISKIEESILKEISNNNIVVSISEYEPTHNMIDNIKERLEKYRIKYELRSFDSKQKFNKPLSLKSDSKYKQKCVSEGCINISDGKIARCPTLMYINQFNRTFHTSLPDVGIIELESICDGGKLLNVLEQSVPLCKHCIEFEIPWSRCGKKLSVQDFAEKE